jgi:methylphosphotriester-DNA--protein-cysteine methyltransferase
VAVTAAVVGNKRSRVYHAPTCRGVAVMKPENRADFPSEAAAEEAGYSRAGDCQ